MTGGGLPPLGGLGVSEDRDGAVLQGPGGAPHRAAVGPRPGRGGAPV